MVIITVSVDSDTNQIFRKSVERAFGNRKGSLGKAFREAMRNWSEDKKVEETRKRLLNILHKGLGKVKDASFSREELYDEEFKRRYRD